MATLIPPGYPPGTSAGEVLVFGALRRPDVYPDWVVLYSLHLPVLDRQVEGEADFVVIMPGLGVLCVEVKGAHRIDYVDGTFYFGSDRTPDRRGPFRQAEEAARSIKKKVTDAFPDARAILFWSAVVFTHCDPSSEMTGDWLPWQLITRKDLDAKPLGALLEEVMRRARRHVASLPVSRQLDLSPGRPSVADCQAVQQALRPDVHYPPATAALRKHREQEIRHFTDEQMDVIESLEGNERAVIEGAAGTGKSVLAFEQLRRAVGDGQRAELLCFNKLLAGWQKQQATDLGLKGAPVSTIHALMDEVVGPHEKNTSDPRYWSERLPDLCLGRLLEQGPLFDMLIIDEAPDLAEPGYLDVMDAMLVGGLRHGCWRLFGDFQGQNLAREPKDIRDLLEDRVGEVPSYRLPRNCRNTPRLADLIVKVGRLNPGYSRVLRPDGGPEEAPNISYYSSDQEQLELLRSAIRDTVGTGLFEPEDVVVLSPKAKSCAAGQAESGQKPELVRLPDRAEGACGYATVAAFKGLEAPAVVLTDIDDLDRPEAPSLFYVGVSRATDRLHILINKCLKAKVKHLLRAGRPSDRGKALDSSAKDR